MADALPKDVLDSAVQPSAVARQKFDLSRRGFDQTQVRSYLSAVADALADAQQREADMRGRLGKAIRRAERAEKEHQARETATDDPAALTRQLGDEVTAVLDAARAAGEQKVAAAEKSADQLIANAKSEATTIRRAAETILEERRSEAEAAAEELLTARRAEADAIVEKARTDAATIRKDAGDDLTRARTQADNLVEEAEQARLQILQDMDRRRRQARAQVERLRVGRDRLLRSYELVRRTLDESTGELKSSLAEAKVMGDTAARRVASESPSSPHQLEAEMADARLVSSTREHPGRAGRGGADRASRPTSTPTGTARPGSTGAAAAPAGDLPPRGAAARPKMGNPPSVADIDDTPAPPASGPAGRSGSSHGLPQVDMPSGSSPVRGDAAPAPRRPSMRDVPRPPAVAPQIKSPEPAAASPSGEAADPTDADAPVGATLPVPTITLERPAEDVSVDDELEDAAADVLEAEADHDDADLDFSGLPNEELAIIVAEDEIEEVVALVPETDTIDGAEIVTWRPADVVEADAEVPPAGDATHAIDAIEATEDVSAKADPVGDPDPAEGASGLFAALRQQTDAEADIRGSTAVDVVDERDTDAHDAGEPAATLAAGTARDVDAHADADLEGADVADQPDADAHDAGEPAAGAAGTEGSDVADERDAAAHDAGEPEPDDESVPQLDATSTDMARQREAIVNELTGDLEKRLKRALADEQNDVLAGIRASTKRDPVDLMELIGETDQHVGRYIGAIGEVAASAYAAGAALLDRAATEGEMPAGAVEELVGSAVVLPIRLRLLELDSLDAEVGVHVDAIRAFYRQRKTDHLTEAAASLAGLLVTAGACDVLGPDEPLPWASIGS